MSAVRPLVVGIGELLWDLLPTGPRPGGAPANFAFHVRQLGANAVIVSAVGHDAAGDRLATWLADMGLPDRYLQRHATRPTGSVTVAINAAGQPHYTIQNDAAWDHLEWTADLHALAGQADCVCVGSLAQRCVTSRDTIQRFLAATRPDCLRIFDVNVRQPHFSADVLRDTLRRTDLLKLNADEWPALAEVLRLDADWRVGLPTLLKAGRIRMAAMTRGALGSVIVDADGVHHRDAPAVAVADTVGAGDAFTAALVVGMLNRHAVDHVQCGADAVAGYVCTQPGATPRLPSGLIEQVLRPAALARVRKAAATRDGTANPSTLPPDPSDLARV